MQLTLYTDYSLRALMFLELNRGKTCTISQIADYYDISRNHLVKVIHNLSQKGYINSTRGKGGGLSLALKASEINIGNVVRDTEPHFNVVECFDPDSHSCSVEPLCKLKPVLGKATQAFLDILLGYTLEDVIKRDQQSESPLTQISNLAIK